MRKALEPVRPEPKIVTGSELAWAAVRVPLTVVALIVTLAGLVVLADGLPRLRWAHLYRQASQEGLGFFWVAIELMVGAVIALVGGTGLAWMATRFCGRAKVALLVAAGGVFFLVAGCALVAFWVESHGTRCIGAC